MSVYIIRPKATSVVRSLNLESIKFTPENRQAQVEEVMDFWQQNPIHQQIESCLEKASSQVFRFSDDLGITGTTIVEMPDDEAERMRQELPNASILRDEPIKLIQPQRNANTRHELSADDLWHLDAIALNIARQNGITGTGKNITIAVFDTGIDSTHAELQDRVAESYAFNSISQQIESISSQDTDGHGTHVAGLICGQQVGVAPDAKLIDCVLIPNGTGNLSNFLIWLDWLALQKNVNIVNISAGLPTFSPEMSNVIDTLLKVGILPVCAVGNNGLNNTRTPANCRDSLSVGATNSHNRIANFSGSGTIIINVSDNVSESYKVPYLVAPGQGVYSSVPDGGYEAWDGTSMAAPIVSGVAALILEKYDKQITVLNLINELLLSCEYLGESPERQGAGLIQVR